MATDEPRHIFGRDSDGEESIRSRALRHPLVQFLGFALFVGTIVVILVAGLDIRGPGQITEDDIGEPAAYDITATRSFSYTSPQLDPEESSKTNRSGGLPVFDWKRDLAQTRRDEINRAFSKIRQRLEKKINEGSERDSSGTEFESLWANLSSARKLRLANESRTEYFSKPVGRSLSDSTFNAFALAGFNTDIETSLASIVGGILSERMISDDLSKLDSFSSNRILLRRISGNQTTVQYQIPNAFTKLHSPRQIPALIREEAQRLDIFFSDKELYNSVLSAAGRLITPNTSFNKQQTLKYQNQLQKQLVTSTPQKVYQKGQTLVHEGEIISQRDYELIQTMYEGTSYLSRIQTITGLTLLTLLFIICLFVFGKQNIRTFAPTTKDTVFMSSALVTFLFMTWLGTEVEQTIANSLSVLDTPALYYLLPVAAGGMLVRLVLNNENAILFTILFSLLVSLITGRSVQLYTYTLLGTIAGIGAVQQVKHRMALVWSGVIVGGINILVIVAFAALEADLFAFRTLEMVILGGLSGVLSGFTVLAFLPVFEAIFDYTTDIKLLELANLNHPLLRQMIVRASGTYHHSMMVGSLSEAAAESIGANALLCRVGAYYHDIGKAKNPHYFVENQRMGENPHDNLKPSMSALIIKAHVKDGLEMAQQHGLPQEIQAFIAQHHGTSLIAYFYRQAKEQEDPDIPEVDEEDFRYPGPRPQSRETAICMLADAIEAASRALPDPSPSRLKGLVRKIINKVFTDGQLDDCDLTLRDLNSIAEAFTRILTGIHHHRPQYPSEAKKPDKEEHTDPPEQTEAPEEEHGQPAPAGPQQKSPPPKEAETFVADDEPGEES